MAKSYGNDGRLKYRVSAGWMDNGAHWNSAGYRELANVEDLTWTNIVNKPETANGKITLYAYGTKPTINIPLSIVIMDK